jgi:hypothetical protein
MYETVPMDVRSAIGGCAHDFRAIESVAKTTWSTEEALQKALKAVQHLEKDIPILRRRLQRMLREVTHG